MFEHYTHPCVADSSADSIVISRFLMPFGLQGFQVTVRTQLVKDFWRGVVQINHNFAQRLCFITNCYWIKFMSFSSHQHCAFRLSGCFGDNQWCHNCGDCDGAVRAPEPDTQRSAADEHQLYCKLRRANAAQPWQPQHNGKIIITAENTCLSYICSDNSDSCGVIHYMFASLRAFRHHV